MDDPGELKRELRRKMRTMRRQLSDIDARSRRLWEHVRQCPGFGGARVVMVFDSVPGEPVTAPFIERCRADGLTVVVPEEEVEPTLPDVVVVPGTAFTPDGRRLGQGGGWYDRFLPLVRSDCLTIGVGFEPQLVDDLPTEPHDVVLDVVITDAGVASLR